MQAAGHFIYVSGLTSRNPDGSVHAPGDVRAQFFTIARPASTMVEVSRLVDPGMVIEIEAVAHTA